MRPTGNHVEAAIMRAIIAEVAGSPCDGQNPVLIVENAESTDWASATFVGVTLQISLRIEGAAASVVAAVASLVDNLPEREIPIAGRIVAEIGVDEGRQIVTDDHIISKNLIVNALVIVD
jgi:hypothetical protein